MGTQLHAEFFAKFVLHVRLSWTSHARLAIVTTYALGTSFVSLLHLLLFLYLEHAKISFHTGQGGAIQPLTQRRLPKGSYPGKRDHMARNKKKRKTQGGEGEDAGLGGGDVQPAGKRSKSTSGSAAVLSTVPERAGDGEGGLAPASTPALSSESASAGQRASTDEGTRDRAGLGQLILRSPSAAPIEGEGECTPAGERACLGGGTSSSRPDTVPPSTLRSGETAPGQKRVRVNPCVRVRTVGKISSEPDVTVALSSGFVGSLGRALDSEAGGAVVAGGRADQAAEAAQAGADGEGGARHVFDLAGEAAVDDQGVEQGVDAAQNMACEQEALTARPRAAKRDLVSNRTK